MMAIVRHGTATRYWLSAILDTLVGQVPVMMARVLRLAAVGTENCKRITNSMRGSKFGASVCLKLYTSPTPTRGRTSNRTAMMEATMNGWRTSMSSSLSAVPAFMFAPSRRIISGMYVLPSCSSTSKPGARKESGLVSQNFKNPTPPHKSPRTVAAKGGLGILARNSFARDTRLMCLLTFCGIRTCNETSRSLTLLLPFSVSNSAYSFGWFLDKNDSVIKYFPTVQIMIVPIQSPNATIACASATQFAP
mmetsp:Transcript_13291/g.30593  ORF Transcript_13291/g.30593 Transcript_13291/m.30593 type:complete len:249 (+) Transcript_13291:209-955(+)